MKKFKQFKVTFDMGETFRCYTTVRASSKPLAIEIATNQLREFRADYDNFPVIACEEGSMNSQQRRFARRHNLVNRFALERAQVEIKQSDNCLHRERFRRELDEINHSMNHAIICALAWSAALFSFVGVAR